VKDPALTLLVAMLLAVITVPIAPPVILENKKGIEKSKRDSREIRVFKRKCMRLS